MKKLVIFIHGYGSNGEDIGFLINYFKKEIKDGIFLNPNAPFKMTEFDNAYYWFPIDELDEEYLMQKVKDVYPIFEKYIEESLEKYNLTYKDIILVGFSQGAVLAIHAALRLKEKIMAVISFSGAMADPNNITRSEMVSKPKIILIHGDCDSVLPCAYSIKAHRVLQNLNIPVELKIIKNLDHSINQQSIDYAINFIKEL
jgi:phospholipase/carboxylesterase